MPQAYTVNRGIDERIVLRISKLRFACLVRMFLLTMLSCVVHLNFTEALIIIISAADNK